MYNNKLWGHAPLTMAAIFLLVGVVSCKTPTLEEKLVTAPVSAETSNTGVSIRIPCVSPVLQQLSKQMKESSRAYAFADYMTIEIFASGTLVTTVDAELAATGDELLAYAILAPGTYTATASIYNYQNSETVPVVSGSSTEFTVTAGGVASVSILCIPESPVSLTYAYQTPSLTPAIIDSNTSDYITYGSEVWYSFTAENTAALLQYEAIDAGYFAVALFDSDGSRVSNSAFYLNSNDSPHEFSDLAVGETYYLLCISSDYSNNGGVTASGNDGSYSLRLYRNLVDSISATGAGTICSLSGAYDSYSLLVSSDVSSVDLEVNTFDAAASVSINGTATADGTATVDVSSGNITVEVTLDGNTQTLVVPISVYTVYSMPYDEVLTLESGMEQTCIITVTSGTSYTVYWDDSYQGTGTYTSDCSVSGSDGAGHSYFSGVDSGYYFGQTFTATSDTLELTVSPTYSAGTVRVWVVENP